MNVLILCAGRGTRLQTVIGDLPKPMIKFGKYTLLQRILYELIPLDLTSKIYINVSKGTTPIVKDLALSDYAPKIQFLYEENPWGPSLTTFELLKLSTQGLLAIHGDLLLESGILGNFVAELTQNHAENALLSVHKRAVSTTSQIIEMDDSGLVKTVVWRKNSPLEFIDAEKKNEDVYVDSGIYYFPYYTIKSLRTPGLNTGISEGLLPQLTEKNLLTSIPWKGLRYAIDTSEKLEFARRAFEAYPEKFRI